MIYIILAAIHVFICILIFVGMQCGVLNVQKYMFIIALLLPFFGTLIVLILHFQIGFDPESIAELDSNKAGLESNLYQNLTVDEKRAGTAVPIEEALILNSAREKRGIIMDVLNEDPRAYVDLLQKAGNNDDTEVVHYAVTAMVEISKENDYALQRFEAEHAANPGDLRILTEYCNFLWSCLEQDLMQGQVEVMNRELFSQLTREKIAIEEALEDYSRLVKNELKRKNYDDAKDLLGEMDAKWPHSEEFVLMNVQYLAAMNKGREIHEFINEIISKGQIYLSTKTKEALAFWMN
jgi:hypothetical protein